MRNKILAVIEIFFIVIRTQSDLLHKKEEINSLLVKLIVEMIKLNENRYSKMAIFSSPDYLNTTSEILKRLSIPVILNAREHNLIGLDTRTPTNVVVVLDVTIHPFDIVNESLWRSDTEFIIVTTELENLDDIFQKFWSHQVINVFSLVVKNSDITLYTFKPFKPENCEKIETKFIQKWTNGNFSQKDLSAVRSNKETINFNQCPVNISIISAKPNVIFHNNCDCLAIIDQTKDKSLIEKCKNGFAPNILTSKCIDGFEGKIMVEITKNLNYTATYVIPEDLKNWGWIKPEPAGVVGHVYLGLSLIGFGALLPTLERFEVLDASVPYHGMECLTFGVPKGAGQNVPTWMNLLLADFPVEVWGALALSYIAMSIVLGQIFKSFSKEFLNNAVFSYVFALTIQVPTKTPKKLALRILIITWCWSTFIVTIVYTTSIGSSLTVPMSNPDVNTFKELLASNLKVTGFEADLKLLKLYVSSNEELRKIAERFVISNEQVGVALHKMTSERNIAYQTSVTSFLYNSRIYGNGQNEIHMVKECIFSYFAAFLLKKRSPLTVRVNKVITNLKEMGIIEYWISQYVRVLPPAPQEFVKLSLNHIQGIFMLVVIGYSIAIICFVFEILYQKYCWNFVKRKNYICSVCL